MFHIPKEAHHVRSYFRDLAAGSTFRPKELVEELKLDWDALTSAEKAELQALSEQAARTIAAFRDNGHFQKARNAADETAATVANLAGERITPSERRKLPSHPKDLAALIRRQ